MWLGLTPIVYSQGSFEEASPIDVAVLTTLLLAAFAIVAGRMERVGPLLRRNIPVLLFFLFCGVSIVWSEFPLVAFKRWSKAVGDLAMVLIVLTESDPLGAVKRLVTQLGFVLIPLSVLFVKYYPSLGRLLAGDVQITFTGVTIQKNSLGLICMMYGIGCLWMFRSAYCDRANPSRRRLLLAYGAILLMTVWLLWQCNSLTSLLGLAMAGGVMLWVSRPRSRNHRALVHWLVVAVLSFSLCAMFFDPGDVLTEAVGRTGSLSGRTIIWQRVLAIPINPWIGTGFESFWLGDRLVRMRSSGFSFPINEAHNGYLEVYLNLGWAGATLLAILLLSGYKKIIVAFRRDPERGSLLLGLFLCGIFYSLTEAAFRMMSTSWIFLLLTFISASTAVRPALSVEMESELADREAPSWAVTSDLLGVHQ
jgi:exopolysaccharide production protein ExoQ